MGINIILDAGRVRIIVWCFNEKGNADEYISR